MEDLINLIVDSLSDDLLSDEYRKLLNRNKYTGHCYVATEVMYYLMDEKIKSEYVPSTLKVNNITHWFLKNKINGHIIDITKKQFNFNLDYTKSINKGFLTKFPSKRALILINKINEKNNY